MSQTSEAIVVPIDGLHARRWTTRGLYHGRKEFYAVGRVEHGGSEWSDGRRTWTSKPGTVQLKQPGDLHQDVRRNGVGVFKLLVFDRELVHRACRGEPRRLRRLQLDVGDPDAAVFHRLHDAIDRCADALALDVLVADALASFAGELSAPVDEAAAAWGRPVRRAVELLHARLTEQLRLDDIAAHAGLDKFHLSRAFRARLGLPPHAYLTKLRVTRAKELLVAGVRPSEIAPLVGFYDQSQLNRHFRRIVGTTPGRYAAYVRG